MLLRMALQPEIDMMAWLLATHTSTESEEMEMEQILVNGTRAFTICALQMCLWQIHMTPVQAGLWDILQAPETEAPLSDPHSQNAFSSRTVGNSAQVSLQSLRPLRDETTRTAERLLRDPPCPQDPWSRSFLDTYHSVELLTGADSTQSLMALALLAQCVTYKTERLHSQNARHSRSSPRVADGLARCGCAAHWLGRLQLFERSRWPDKSQAAARASKQASQAAKACG